jgi:glutamate racemase
MAGEPVADAAIWPRSNPASWRGRTAGALMSVCLSCTHYPLLLPSFERLAPWPVTWIDPPRPSPAG